MKHKIKEKVKSKVIIVHSDVHIEFKAFCASRSKFIQDVASEALREKMKKDKGGHLK
jgi:hypothetical protein